MSGIVLADESAGRILSGTAVPVSLDECVQKIINAFTNERTAAWDAGDALNDALREQTTGADQEPLFRYLASQTGCTTNRLKQLAAVARTFEPGMRNLERAWSWHRAVYNAAKRNDVAPADMLAKAEQWTQTDLDAYGSTAERVSWAGECLDCGFVVRVSCRKPGIRALKGEPVQCPICLDEHGYPTEIGRLG